MLKPGERFDRYIFEGFLAEGGIGDVHRARTWLRDIARALAATHRARLVDRDLQPKHALLSSGRRRWAGWLLSSALLVMPSSARAEGPSAGAFLQQRDRFMAQRNGVVSVLGAWSALSLTGGALIAADPPWLPRVAATRAERRAFGVATLSFAIVNSVFAIYGAARTSALRSSLTDLPSLARERRGGGSFFAVNAGLDMLYISAGALLSQTSQPLLRGFGAGVLSQGGFLIGFDTSAALLYRHGGR